MLAVRSCSLLLSASIVLGACNVDDGVEAPAGVSRAATTVPGQADRADQDSNGYADVGVVVTGHYTSLYAYDAAGDYYWDLGDGRVEGTVPSVDALDAGTLTRCQYQINYRGQFQNDPFLDTGWISNHIRCSGHDPTATYQSVFVHRSDPRYLGDPARAIWGDWEIHVDAISHFGNWARPHRPVASSR